MTLHTVRRPPDLLLHEPDQGDVKRIEATFATDHLNLVLTGSYVRSLLRNAEINRYLEKYHRELRQEFLKICEATALVSEAAE